MIAVLVATLSTLVLGLPAALALDRRASGPLLLGTAFLYGSGLVFFVLLVLSELHVRWTILTITIALLIVWSALWLISRRRQPTTDNRQPFHPHWLDLATLLTMTGYAFYATLTNLWEWDFWAIWGMKARVFLGAAGIDWHFLESRWNAYVHPDYPLLVPLNYDFVGLLQGGWSDRWLGVLAVAWAVALLLIVRDLAQRESSPIPAALAAFVVAPIAASRFVGIGEGPLIAFAAAAVLFLRRGVLFDDAVAWRHGAVLLGLAGCVKNEGLALIVAVAVALLLVQRRSLWRLWPAVAIAAPWLILRAGHELPTDLASGPVLERVLARMPYAADIASLLTRTVYHPFFWMALLAAFLIVPMARRREAFVLVVTAIQTAFYVGSYFATPNDPRWHIATSWSRLTEQLAIPITVVVVLMLARTAAGVEESPRAEARSLEPSVS